MKMPQPDIQAIPSRSKIARPWLMLAVLALLGAIVWHGSRHASTGPAVGTHINATLSRICAGDKKTFRIGTFNIHGGKGGDGRRDLGRVADCIADLDFAGLNEVHGATLFGQPDQAEQLGRRLGAAWLFAPADRQWWYQEFGNGFVTRLPVARWQRIPLPRAWDRSYRNMVLLEMNWPNSRQQSRTVHLLLAHVNRRYDAERQMQLKEVIRLYLSLARPSILMGDLNSDARDPQIRRLLDAGATDVLGDVMPERIDWIFVRGLKCAAAAVSEKGASDHPMVWAELELP
jgi:endonuclease/exonuclease/phosphatase family metal-dependent hydrolase